MTDLPALAALLEDGRLHPRDRGEPGEAVFTGEAAVAVEPIDLGGDGDAPLLPAPVALVGGSEDGKPLGGGIEEEGLDLHIRPGWLAFTARQ